MIYASFGTIAACLLILDSFVGWSGVLGQTATFNTSMQNESGFIGWYMGPSITQALTDTESWTTSGSYARGCPTSGACAFPTDCQDNSITYDNGDIASCNQCRTMTIFQTVPFGTPSVSNIFCASYWVAFTVFRELPTTTTSSTSSTITTLTSTSSATPTSVTASTTKASSTTASPANSSDTSGSKAWIAGAVVGPIAGVALIAGIISWLIYHRNKKAASSPTQEPFINSSYSQPREAFAPAQEMDAVGTSTVVHELSSYK